MGTARQAAALLRFLRWGVGISTIVVGVLAWSVSAFAYRPFDGTDAAVADPGEVEIELQPCQRVSDYVLRHAPGK